MRWFICILMLAAFCLVPRRGHAQTDLDHLYDHFVGNWVGTSNDYTVSPAVHATIRIVITRERKGRRLHLSYTYDQPGKPSDNYQRTMVIDPAERDFFIKRIGIGKGHYQADGLDQLLRSGFGDFTLHGSADIASDHHALYRGDYHLSATSFSYEIYTSSHGGPFVKMSDWTTIRESSASQSPPP